MLRAVTNRDFPLLAQALRDLFGIELEYDPALFSGRLSLREVFRAGVRRDPQGRIRIVYVDQVEDLSDGWAKDIDVIGFNMRRHKLLFVAVPPAVEPISPDCARATGTLDGYLLAVTLHELYENLTGDMRHCRHPGTCINSICRAHESGTCCVCMGGLIDEKWPHLRLEDLFCEEDIAELREALGR